MAEDLSLWPRPSLRDYFISLMDPWSAALREKEPEPSLSGRLVWLTSPGSRCKEFFCILHCPNPQPLRSWDNRHHQRPRLQVDLGILHCRRFALFRNIVPSELSGGRMLLVSIALPCATPRVPFRTKRVRSYSSVMRDSPLHCEATRPRAPMVVRELPDGGCTCW